ncbi:hypothetical protein [Polyangium sp. y55x31]|uniref:hypothetical protein n=1 Tax=Polyangium sp. y55x31 TaxID=3042688 RepID=UPI002482F338|nr:hypothetical protein [Polyangium sp. y55x31]
MFGASAADPSWSRTAAFLDLNEKAPACSMYRGFVARIEHACAIRARLRELTSADDNKPLSMPPRDSGMQCAWARRARRPTMKKIAFGMPCMPVVLGWLVVATVGCTTETAPVQDDETILRDAAETSASAIEAQVTEVKREPIVDDIYHYSFLVKVGNTPNARIRVHRIVREDAPWRARSVAHAILLLHGDFATFETNFAPSLKSDAAQPDQDLAVYLAQRGIDVWGLDRRWTTAPKDGADFSDFADMGVVQAVSDAGSAIFFARSIRGMTGAGRDPLILGGFSSGAQITYLYAAEETQKAPGQRQVKGIVPIDIYAKVAPEDAASKQVACDNAAQERDLVAQGEVDSDNSAFFQPVGELAASAPADPSPFYDGYSNRDVLLGFVTQTYQFYEPKPKYHLVGGIFKDGAPTELRYAPEALISDWLAFSPPHQALVESADRDALWCGEAPLPLDDHLADITVPLFYLGAAGGFGDHGLYTTTVVGSTDVTTHVVRRLPVENEPEDFGHGDLLYAADASTLAWEPLAQWLLAH